MLLRTVLLNDASAAPADTSLLPSVFHNHAVSGRRPQLRGAHNSTHFRRDSPPVKVSAPPPPVHVGLLAGHSPAAWKDAPKEGTVDAVKQNLQVYAAAVATAAAAGVQLLLLPEAYGLWSSATKDGFWEPLSNSSTPCSGADASAQPMQKELACLAAKHGVALAYNGFVTRGGARRITEVVLDQKGALVATYDKVHLFPVTERAMGATAGVNAPVSFELLGRRWGVLICYEGVWPYTLDGNFKQMEALKAQGAGSWLWSIGSEIPIDIAAKKLAKKFGVKIAATEDKSTPSFADELICEGAVECKHVDTALPAITGYGAKAYVRSALL